MSKDDSLILQDGFFDRSVKVQYSRNRLPHWHQEGVWIFVTWRLGDSLPQSKLIEIQQQKREWEKNRIPPGADDGEMDYETFVLEKVERWLDSGFGSCVLRDLEIRRKVEQILRYGDSRLYDLGDFVLMPNHVHLLFRPKANHPLAKAVGAWKSASAREINRAMGGKGKVWQEDFWDRIIRNEGHFQRCVSYIQENPAKANLSPGEYTLGKGSGV